MSGDGAMASSSVAKSSTTQSGPPYFCPTCQTSYSRLEYLRRHERRHADERPFVCDCGKGFSRSDVLSRHKRQCAVVLNGGEGGANGSVGDLSSASNKANGGKRTSTSGPLRRKSSTSRGGGKAAGRKSRGSGARNNSLNQSADDDDDDDDDDGHRSNSPPFVRPGQHHGMHPSGIPSSITTSANSFPFPPQPGVQQMSSGPPPLLPPAPYGGADGGMMGGQSGAGAGAGTGMGGVAGGSGMGQTNNSPFGGVMQSHHLSAFNNLVNQQHHYPSSPESNGTVSQHGSPRFSARDMARHGSNGSRTFSLRKGGSFDHIGPRNASGAIPGTTPNQYAPEFWDALDPAAKNASTMAGSDYMSAGAAVGLGDASNGGSSSVSSGLNGASGGGVTTPRGGESHRFAVSTGPLSPFSTIALTSTMSPYLSAFSNARDTPFVASPSRGLIPGTPGSNLNVFDWTMRPPSKPASSTMAKRDSLSHGSTSASTVAGAGSSAAGGTTSTSASTNTSPSSAQNKRKREEEEGSRKSPKIDYYSDSQTLDDDHRSAAELLDSLRTAGLRPAVQTPGATDASTIASSTAPVSAPVEMSVSAASTSLPAVSSIAEDDASNLAAVSAAADAAAISAISEAPIAAPAPVVSEQQIDPIVHQGDEKKASTTTRKTENDAVATTSQSPPQRNLTLSQLPLSSAPTSAAGLAQSSWEALMNGNGWSSGGGTSSASAATNSINPLASDEKGLHPSAGNAAMTSKITPERTAQIVGDEPRRQSS